MYCPQCGGVTSEEDSFCSRCGAYLTVEPAKMSQTYTEGYVIPDVPQTEVSNSGVRNHPKNFSKLFLVLLVVFILLAVSLFIPGQSHGSLMGKSFSETADVADNAILGTNYCITPISGFVDENGKVIVSMVFTDGSGANSGFMISLADENISSCSWTITGRSLDYTVDSRTSTDPSPVISHLYGDCTASVSYTDSSGTSVTETFAFSVDLHRSYSWEFDGGNFSFDTVIDFESTYNSSSGYSYLKPTSEIINKQTMHSLSPRQWSNTPDFVIINDSVQSYADTLGKLYSSAYGDKSLDQKYANFLLGYVQMCYTYALDSDLYDEDEYFAFSIQTIYYGKGDCEDTSILAAAIAGAAGFQVAVFLLPQHATVGIALNTYSRPQVSNGEILSQVKGGVTYYSGETTVDSFQELGVSDYYVDSAGVKHSYSDYFGVPVSGYGTYGAYIVNTKGVMA